MIFFAIVFKKILILTVLLFSLNFERIETMNFMPEKHRQFFNPFSIPSKLIEPNYFYLDNKYIF